MLLLHVLDVDGVPGDDRVGRHRAEEAGGGDVEGPGDVQLGDVGRADRGAGRVAGGREVTLGTGQSAAYCSVSGGRTGSSASGVASASSGLTGSSAPAAGVASWARPCPARAAESVRLKTRTRTPMNRNGSIRDIGTPSSKETNTTGRDATLPGEDVPIHQGLNRASIQGAWDSVWLFCTSEKLIAE